MTTRARLGVFAVVSVVLLGGSVAYVIHQREAGQDRARTAPTVPVATAGAGSADEAVLYFRHTGLDNKTGTVASVAVTDPGGPRTFTGVVCDRVAATRTERSCLRTGRGVLTSYAAVELDEAWGETGSSPLPGVPSRTRLSPDGSLVATTSFVSGHSYLATGFSTATEVHGRDGTDHGNLEEFALVVDGRPASPRDRNLWGVTFADDARTFYLTVGTGGRTYLARGDLVARTLTTIAADVECPALSPDGSRVAFKQADRQGAGRSWTPAVLDLASGRRTVLGGEARSIDDQPEWLDDDTLLYGVPRPDEPGVTDVWSLDTTTAASPRLLIEQAWSPSVVR